MGHQGRSALVAMSGGVDSTASAMSLLEAGCDCTGVFMITSEQSHHAQRDVERVAGRLGIELIVLDLRPEFESILDYFSSEYKRGRTPNPCVLCNRTIKFGKLLTVTHERGLDCLATGHYARIVDFGAGPGLYAGADAEKDQSYVLAMVKKDALRSVVFPMGEQTKAKAREIVAKLGLNIENKAESQEICFIPDDDYVSVLEQRDPQLAREGRIVDSSGRVLGEHDGIHRYTIGQRRGLRVAMGKPHYVTQIDPVNNVIRLGPKEEVVHTALQASRVNWLIDPPSVPFPATIKVRYNDQGTPGMVHLDGEQVIVRFEQPKLAVTPGQLAVFYVAEHDLPRVAGAAWIDAVEH